MLYRVTPMYNEEELVCRGVRLEAQSVEDHGKTLCFHVYCYNLQPHVQIDYATGRNQASGTRATKLPPKPNMVRFPPSPGIKKGRPGLPRAALCTGMHVAGNATRYLARPSS